MKIEHEVKGVNTAPYSPPPLGEGDMKSKGLEMGKIIKEKKINEDLTL